MESFTDKRVAYLGPAGTFSEQAVRRFFGREAEALPQVNFDEVLNCVERAEVDYGLIAIENNTNGTVTHALDLLLERPLSIVGEVSVPVVHNLMNLSGTLRSVRRVYAHAQALGQCRGWLRSHLPGAQTIAVSSNAEGARLASEDPEAAGIAALEAASIYGLKTVAQGIQDGFGNRTRFLVMSREPEKILDSVRQRKTSIVFSVANEPGSLYRILFPLAENSVQMVRIESRPARNGNWEYNFFIDLACAEDDPPLARALETMRAEATYLRVLGSYPVLGE